jgi:hypothetical protein
MSVLQGESESRAVLDGRTCRHELVGRRLGDAYDDVVAVVVEGEELRCLGEALLVPLAEPQVGSESHDDRRR